MAIKRWTEERDRYLREHYLTQSNRQLAQQLGLPVQSVRYRLSRLRLVRRPYRFWTPQEILTLRDWSGEATTQEVGRKLNRSRYSVYGMQRKLGLTKLGSRSRNVERLVPLMAYMRANAEGVTVSQAAKQLGIPETTMRGYLRDMVKGRVAQRYNIGQTWYYCLAEPQT